MTPSAMLSKFIVDGDDFLGELEGEDLWTFLQTPINDVLAPFNNAYGIYDYDRLRLAVVAEKRREYDAEVDVWLNHFAHQQYGKAHSIRYLDVLKKFLPFGSYTEKLVLLDLMQYLEEL